MVAWVVLVRTEHGVEQIVLEADFVEHSDDGSEVNFFRVAQLADALALVQGKNLDINLKDQLELFRRFIHELSKVSVGSFKTEVVVGYYQTSEQVGRELS